MKVWWKSLHVIEIGVWNYHNVYGHCSRSDGAQYDYDPNLHLQTVKILYLYFCHLKLHLNALCISLQAAWCHLVLADCREQRRLL